MTQQTSVALDVGRSALKIAYRDSSTGRITHALTPTAVIPAFTITDTTERERAVRDTVKIGAQTYFVGDTALMQGKESDNALTDDWVFSPEYLALLTHGLQMTGVQEPILILGLPSKAHRHDAKALKERVSDHFGCEALVMPQPMGAYYEHMLGDSGVPVPGRVMTQESWASVDIGRYSTDLVLMLKGRWIEQVSESFPGAVTAVDHLRRALREEDVDLDFSEAEQALLTKTLRWYGKQREVAGPAQAAIDHLVHDITASVARLLEHHARKLDGVIVAGGGAHFVAEALRARWPHVVVPDDIRFAVAEGMRRAGDGHLRAQRMTRTA